MTKIRFIAHEFHTIEFCLARGAKKALNFLSCDSFARGLNKFGNSEVVQYIYRFTFRCDSHILCPFTARQRLRKYATELLVVDHDRVVTSSTTPTPCFLKITQENRTLILNHCFVLRKGDFLKPVCLENVGIREKCQSY